jgi:arabinogalactan endo-1,4-beta-galactosidase
MVLASAVLAAEPADKKPTTFYAGADISMLPELEKAGAVYRDRDGKPGDALTLFRDHGWNLFRVRLFVDPDPDYAKSHGAIQDLAYVRALAKRIKSAGGQFLLDLHYSDTWADPGKQFKPKAWKDLDFDALEKRTHDYTAEVLKDLIGNGAAPEMVQVGNEIASGILWPDGKVWNPPDNNEDAAWQRFARLLNAGVRAVREASPADRPIRVMLHIHGGGKPGLAKWFFVEKLGKYPVDFDVVGLSFYPTWDDQFDALKQNLADVATLLKKDVVVAEVSYPWKAIPDVTKKPTLLWPQTPQGQLQFFRDLCDALRATPDSHGIGFIYWYPEAIPIPGRRIWREGGEAIFDDKGNVLPAIELMQKPQ